MRKISEVLRLEFAAGLSHEKIARAVGLSKGALNKYVGLAEAPGRPATAGTASATVAG